MPADMFLEKLQAGLFGRPNNPAGALSDADLKAAQQQAMLAMGAQLLAAGGPSSQPVSLGQALGQGLMAGRQAQAGATDSALESLLLKAQIEKAQQPVTPKQPNSIAEYEYAKQNGFTGTFDDWKRIASIEAKDPASIQEYNLAKSEGYQGTFRQWLQDRAQYTVGAPYQMGEFGGARGPFNRVTGGFTPITTLEQEAEAGATTKEAETRAAELARAQAERDATFQADMNVIDDEILRTQRLLTEFKEGKYQTGPIAGRLPNFRTAAQDLSREQGKDTIKAISSATFGALSEGEREFLRNLGVSETASEESNINMLERRLEELQRAKGRLLNRARLGVGPNAAPASVSPSGPVEVGQTVTINGVKVTRKK